MNVQLHLFLKTKFLFVLFSRTQLLNILKIQFEAFKFKECPASPLNIWQKEHDVSGFKKFLRIIPMETRKFRFCDNENLHSFVPLL